LCTSVPRRKVYDQARTAKYYLILKDATHFTFGNKGCGGLPLPQAVSEEAQPRVICRYALAFFDKHLRQDAAAEPVLKESDPALVYYVKEEKLGEALEWGKEPPEAKGGAGGIWEEIRRDRAAKRWKWWCWRKR
jgi:hypothetical protein